MSGGDSAFPAGIILPAATNRNLPWSRCAHRSGNRR